MSSRFCVRNNLIRWLYGIDLMKELARDYGLRGIALSGYGWMKISPAQRMQASSRTW